MSAHTKTHRTKTNSPIFCISEQGQVYQLPQSVLRRYIVNDNVRIRKVKSKAVSDVKSIAAGAAVDSDSVLELVTLFADTWFSLDAYDRDALTSSGATKKKVTLTAEKLDRSQ